MNDTNRKAMHAKGGMNPKTCLKCGDAGVERGHLVHWETKHPFNLKQFERNEDRNNHSENALLLVQKYGTASEVKELKDINKAHHERGHITKDDFDRRTVISNKYHKNLQREHRLLHT